jgi:hypothetical protein
MVDVTNQDRPVESPPPANEAPLMANPVLARSTRGGGGKGGGAAAWYVGVPVAVVLLGAGAWYVAAQNHHNGLMTNAPTAPVQQTAPIAAPPPSPAPAPAAPGPQATPAPAPMAAAAPEPKMTPVKPSHAPRFASTEPRGHHVTRASSASEATEDAAAVAPSAPSVAAKPAPSVSATPAPTAPAPVQHTAPVAQPAAPPVITPPSAGS